MNASSHVDRTAIVLFNLGGPDALPSVEPFLFNLFNDKAIIALPNPLRWLIAKLISRRRAPIAQHIYAQMGGKSPILGLTQAQAGKLEARLGEGYRVFVSMRYWHPFSDEVARQVKAYAPDRILLLPLYPQFSTTTTGSSVKDWQRVAKKAGLHVPTETICCYPTHPHFIASHAAQLLKTYEEALLKGSPRILFSAHGLPEKIIRAGDPYQWQVEQTVAAILETAFGGTTHATEIDAVTCYQSRVGPMRWIGPSTDQEIVRAAEEHLPIVVVPVAFVSEHSETLVELDIEYRALAETHGTSNYFRVPALGIDDWFIDALVDMALANGSQKGYAPIHSHCGARICPKEFGQCPMAA